MRWLKEWLNLSEPRPQEDREDFEERERRLRDRTTRLERLAVEVDAIAHPERHEERRR